MKFTAKFFLLLVFTCICFGAAIYFFGLSAKGVIAENTKTLICDNTNRADTPKMIVEVNEVDRSVSIRLQVKSGEDISSGPLHASIDENKISFAWVRVPNPNVPFEVALGTQRQYFLLDRVTADMTIYITKMSEDPVSGTPWHYTCFIGSKRI